MAIPSTSSTASHIPAKMSLGTRCSEARQQPGRMGSSLIDTIATMSVLLVLGVCGASIVGAITDVGVHTRQSNLGRASVERLAPVIRDDLHAADQVSASAGAWPLQLTTGQRVVRYQYDQDKQEIRRSQSNGNTLESADRFPLPPRTIPRLLVEDEIVAIVVKEGPHPWIIEVVR